MSVDVRFLNETHQIVLSDQSRSSPYTFLKEKLSLETCTNICQQDIEVHQVGSDLPSNVLWPVDRPLKPGTYRVTIKSGGRQASIQESSSWQVTIRIDQVDHGGYWQEASTVPNLLHLLGTFSAAPDCNSIRRLAGYVADDVLLEFPYYHEFPPEQRQLDFATDTALSKANQDAQNRHIKLLHARKLMLRITNFSDTQELLLRPNSNGNFYGYIRPKGVIENIALSQFHKFVNTKQLVLVLDLDGTLIHTADRNERESFRACEHAVELHIQDEPESWFCIPRARLLEFFLQVVGKYHVMFCTAGAPQYARTVIDKLRETLLSNPDLTEQEQHSLQRSVDARRLVCNSYSSNRQFKSLRMILPVAHLPELAERMFIILDDRNDVWRRDSDRKLVWQISQQHSFTSYSAPAPSLERYGALFSAIHDFVYNHDRRHRVPLPDIPDAGMQHWLQHGGHNAFASLLNPSALMLAGSNA